MQKTQGSRQRHIWRMNNKPLTAHTAQRCNIVSRCHAPAINNSTFQRANIVDRFTQRDIDTSPARFIKQERHCSRCFHVRFVCKVKARREACRQVRLKFTYSPVINWRITACKARKALQLGAIAR